MAKYTKWMAYKGKRILFVSAPGLPEAEVIAAFEEMKQDLLRQGGAVARPVPVDISGIGMTTKVIDKAK